MITRPHEWIWDSSLKGKQSSKYDRETGYTTHYYNLSWRRLKDGRILLRSTAMILIWPGLEEILAPNYDYD